MYGFNGYGGYGGGGMMGGGGSEMMIILVCCICCLCLVSVAGGYLTNVFCGISPSLGSSCSVPDPEPPETSMNPDETEPPRAATTCSEAYGRAIRIGNDPRPAIRPEYCQGSTPVVGRDCYYWEVQQDPVTGMARWMRKPDGDKGDMRFGGSCAPQVRCAARIDPTSLDRYTETDPTQLLRQCTAVQPRATNEAATLAVLTAEARAVGATWTGVRAWTRQNSKVWYDRVARYVAQRDLKAYIVNSVRAADRLKRKLNSNTLRKSTFCYILEAAVRSPNNSADWIINTTNGFRGRTEKQYVAFIRGLFRDRMVRWESVIDDPLAVR